MSAGSDILKEAFLNKSIQIIKSKYSNYDEIKIEELKYGLEGLYLSITKLVIISIIAAGIGIFKEMVILLLLFNVIRAVSFGLHARNSLICLISSAIVFLACPILCKIIVINNYIKLFIAIPTIILITIFSPADTEKRPIISRKRRLVYKILSLIISATYMILCILVKDNFIGNTILCSLLIQLFLVNPISYKIFGVSYNNYKNYLKKK